jgi:xanthine dehydrogenase YagR molybdenum-binding subunit
MSVIGAPLNRVDGRLKVTGAAKYSAEFEIPELAYAVMVLSTIPSGRIRSMDTASSKRAAGVISIITADNAPKLPGAEKRLSLLQDDLIHYNNQPIAVVVAKTLHQAQYAASLIRTQYVETPAKLDFVAGFPASYPGSHNNEPGDVSWGNTDEGLSQAEVTIDQIYTTPINHHNPLLSGYMSKRISWLTFSMNSASAPGA